MMFLKMNVLRERNNVLQTLLLLSGYLQILLLLLLLPFTFADIDYNTLNDDGSYSFRHTNDDIGGYYHSASASPDNVVRGRYGSRNPATGQVDEVVYTAGPRGFRANGPKIHRKMDLAQYPPRPIGSPDDPLADPYDDPSYSFNYRNVDSSRSENSDSTGRIRGLYSYLDDVGERHSVRYAAGAGTGFEVSNAVPDNPISVGYSSPLYKSHPKARGKMTVQRGPNGSYKLIAAGPDHRRAESRGSDGFVRGTYSYLDDKGVQRTVEYIAGAGIGYRIIQNSIGPGTHVNPSVTDFRLTDTDFRLANEYGRGAGSIGSSSRTDSYGPSGADGAGGRGGGGGGIAGRRGGSIGGSSLENNNDGSNFDGSGNGRVSGRGRGGSINRIDAETDVDNGLSADDRSLTGGRPGSSGSSSSVSSGPSRGGSRTTDSGSTFGNRVGSRPTSNRNPLANEERSRGSASRNRDRDRDRDRTTGKSSNRGSSSFGSSSSSKHSGGGGGGGGYNYDPPSTADNYKFNDDDVGSLPPLITANRKILEIDRERDWVDRHRDSTVVKNVGKWYIGLPPGQSVRAHVQNIDLIPIGGRRVPSPSEALRQDEIADMVASLENDSSYVS